MMSALTPKQQQALALDRNISVTAGAGSGKTKILVERFLKIILDENVPVSRVLAITFTQKAAAEMHERVAAKISAELSACENEEKRRRLLAVRDQLRSVNISTIHSFCGKILREFPIEAGLPPEFSEADPMRSSLLIKEAIDASFKSLSKQKIKNIDSFYNLFMVLGQKNIENLLTGMLKNPFDQQLIISLYQSNNEAEWIALLKKKRDDIIHVITRDIDEDHLKRLTAQILKGGIPNKRSGNSLKTETALRTYIQNKGDAFENLKQFLRYFVNSNGKAKKGASLYAKNQWDDFTKDLILDLAELAERYYESISVREVPTPPNDYDRLFYKAFHSIIILYEYAQSHYSQQKKELGLVDFEDLLILTYKLLENDDTVKKTLAKRFRYVMVDEFQDTNHLQWQIISRLSLNTENMDASKFFIVGDPKQAIYGFRNSDIRIFSEVRKVFNEINQQNGKNGDVVFEDSFRFVPSFNAFINDLFKKILVENPDNSHEVKFDPLNAKRKTESGYVELAIQESESSAKGVEERFVATRIKRMVDGEAYVSVFRNGEETRENVQYGHIAVLVRTANQQNQIERELRKQNIHYKSAGGMQYWQKQEIYDIYHLLRFLQNSDDDLALTAILRSNLFMFSDILLFKLFEIEGYCLYEKMKTAPKNNNFCAADLDLISQTNQYLEKWFIHKDRIPLTELLNLIFDDLSLIAVYYAQPNGEQVAANMMKLMSQLENFEQTLGGSLGDFLDVIELFIENGMSEGEAILDMEESNTVKIMTIHKSKGLEFPVVFLPFLNRNLTGNNVGILYDVEWGYAPSLKTETEAKYALQGIIQYLTTQKELAEEKRLFYVGATRAQNSLIMSASIKVDEEGVYKNFPKNSIIKFIENKFDEAGFNILETSLIENASYKLHINRNAPAVNEKTLELSEINRKFDKLIAENKKNKAVDISAFGVLEDHTGARYFSATKIMTFQKNQQEYINRYISGFFDSDYEAFRAGAKIENTAVLEGKVVHRFLEMRELTDKNVEDLITDILYEYELYDKTLHSHFVESISQLEIQLEKSTEAASFMKASETKSEVSIDMKIENDFLTGALDKIYKYDDEWEILDYKTNRIVPKNLEKTAQTYEWQMKTYALLLQSVYPKQEQYKVHYYFTQIDKLYSICYSNEQLSAIKMELIHIIKKMKALEDQYILLKPNL
jgi:ATP-dependent helicase/nuclease subunit A